MADTSDNAQPAAPQLSPGAPAQRKKRGPPKGVRYGGKQKGTKNKATIERERAAALALERERVLQEGRAAGAAEDVVQAQVAGKKLMKEIAFDFAQMFASIAAYYQPAFRPVMDAATGMPARDELGRVQMAVSNPNYDEKKFLQYGELATHVALGAAPFESPKLAAVMLEAGMVSEIEVVGGLPDEEDGGFYAADALPAPAESGAPGAGNPGTGSDQGAGQHPGISSGPGAAIPDKGQAQGGPVRKAVG